MDTAHKLPRTPKVKLTDVSIREMTANAIREKRDVEARDALVPGLRVRARQSGHTAYLWGHGGNSRGKTIGAAPGMAIADARKLASKLYLQLKSGDDPLREQPVKAETPLTFLALAKRYLEQQQTRMRPAPYAALERNIEGHAKPLHSRPAHEISLREVAACIDAIDLKGHKSNGDASRRNLRSAISGVFRFGMQRGLVTTNPVVGLMRYTVPSRERVLSLSELRSVWLASGDDDFGTIIRLLILTGQRRMEIGALRLSEIEADAIVLPGARTKNHREHHVPLPPLARQIIDQQIARQIPDREFIFGRRSGMPFGNWGKAKKALDRAIAAERGEPLAEWVLHDLRRSVATHLNELSIAQPHIVEALLNHVSGHKGGVAGTYNRALYRTEKATALNRWAEFLLTLIDGRSSNVTSLRA